MNHSQKSIVDVFLAGNFPGESGVPRHIETVISNVFIFETKAYKLYKNDNAFFNENFRDLSQKSTRFSFTRDDFAWNHASTPSIYTDLVGVRDEEGTIVVIAADDTAEELVIVMNRIDTEHVLFERLVRGDITAKDAYAMGEGLCTSLARVREGAPLIADYHEIFGKRIADAKAWAASSEKEFDEGELESYIDFVEKFRTEKEKKFKNALSRELAYGGDIHSHNALYTDGEFFLMDTFSPKEEWLVEHHSVPAFRMATDIWALSGSREYFDAFLEGYKSASGRTIDSDLEAPYVVYVSLIALPYLYMLAGTDQGKRAIAERFHSFLRNYFSGLTER